MKIYDLKKNRFIAVLGIIAVLAGILVLPAVLNRLYGFDTVITTFLVILIYAALNFVYNN